MASSSSSPALAEQEHVSFARRCWLKFRYEALRAISYTPFVVCLAAGNLAMEVFQHYISQDVHFLRALAQAYEVAEEHADNDDTKAEISQLREAVLEELEVSNLVLEEWGIDPTRETGPIPTTEKYTKFLLDIAGGYFEEVKGVGKIVTPLEKTKLAAYIIGALTPCMCLYACLGQQLQIFLGDVLKCHAYMKWVTSYSSPSFQVAAVQFQKLLDKLSVAMTSEELELVEKIYHQAMQLEVEFFSAQPVVQQTAFPLTRLHDPADGLVVFSGFDLTCTVFDSCAILAEIEIQMAAKADDIEDDNSIAQKSTSDMKKSREARAKQFTEYEQSIESAQEVKPFNSEDLYNGLEEVSEFELANSRAVDSEMLSGIKLDAIKRAGERLILQDGCADFFQTIVKKKNELNAEIHIISCCWYADLIRSSFSSVGCPSELNVHSNEFNYESSVLTGELGRKKESPRDKLEAFRDILSKCSSKPKHLSVYIGGTVGDLLCLLDADVGIVIGESISLIEFAQKFGVCFVPLRTSLIFKQTMLDKKGSSIWKAGGSGILHTVSTWSEIAAFLFGLGAQEFSLPL